MIPTTQQVDELRNMFIKKYENDSPKFDFHRVDIDRIRNGDLWCTRFLEEYNLDTKVSLDQLWITCIWRQEFGANDLNETNVRLDYLQDGFIFARNKDLDGYPLLIFKTKLHIKGGKDMNEVLKVLVYWLERIQREIHLSKITIFFDMDGTGLSNMDLEFIKMIIKTLEQYYPNSVNYIIVFEMAWVLNAAFKIVKALLPEKAVEILKVIKKKDINQYIDKDNCLTSWGGNDNYQFSFVPEQKKSLPIGYSQNFSDAVVPSTNDEHNNNIEDKKVHFANNRPTRMPAADRQDSQINYIPENFTSQDHDMLRVAPQDFLVFTYGDSKESTLDLRSTTHFPVIYKIQTTSPEKFRVRPRCCILNPSESISVNILLKPEHNLSENGKDKFLIMCLPAVDIQSNYVADFWKKQGSNAPNIEQHGLCCVYKDDVGFGASGTATFRNGYSASSGDRKADAMVANDTRKLEKQLRNTKLLQIVTLVFLFILSVAVIYLLKLQLCCDDGCCANDDTIDNSDFSSCAKGKADL